MFYRRKERNVRRGAAAVEMAFVLPIFLMLLLGIVEFGRGMMATQLLQHAAREGSRRGALQNSTNATVTDSVKEFLTDSLGVDEDDITVGISIIADPSNTTTGNEISDASRRDLVEVEVEVDYASVSLIPGKWLNGATLRGTSVMRKE